MGRVRNMIDKVVHKLSDNSITVSILTGMSSIVTPPNDGVFSAIERHSLAVLSILIAAVTFYGKLQEFIVKRRTRNKK